MTPHVLLIAPNADEKTFYTTLLTASGLNVVEADSPEAALEQIETTIFPLVCYAGGTQAVFEFCSQLRAKASYRHIPVLMLTVDDNPKTLKQALLAGVTDILSGHDEDEIRSYLARFVSRQQRQVSGRVLLIEDSAVLQTVIIDLLTDLGLDVDSYTHAEDAWEAFQYSPYDLVITDIMLEGSMTGVSLVRKIRRIEDSITGRVPIIATSGFDNSSRKVELFHLGINDYVSKPILREELTERVINHVQGYQVFRELRNQQQTLNSLAMLDPLTQLFSRHALREFSAKYFNEAKRSKTPLSLAVLDLDLFGNINQEHGQQKADEVLASLGTWLKRFSRKEDIVARWSGDEFVLLLSNTHQDGVLTWLGQLQRQLADFKPGNIGVTLSIGVAHAVHEIDHNLNTLFEKADKAMYQSKILGRNRITSYEDSTALAQEA